MYRGTLLQNHHPSIPEPLSWYTLPKSGWIFTSFNTISCQHIALRYIIPPPICLTKIDEATSGAALLLPWPCSLNTTRLISTLYFRSAFFRLLLYAVLSKVWSSNRLSSFDLLTIIHDHLIAPQCYFMLRSQPYQISLGWNGIITMLPDLYHLHQYQSAQASTAIAHTKFHDHFQEDNQHHSFQICKDMGPPSSAPCSRNCYISVNPTSPLVTSSRLNESWSYTNLTQEQVHSTYRE